MLQGREKASQFVHGNPRLPASQRTYRGGMVSVGRDSGVATKLANTVLFLNGRSGEQYIISILFENFEREENNLLRKRVPHEAYKVWYQLQIWNNWGLAETD